MRKKSCYLFLTLCYAFFSCFVSGQNKDRNLLTSKYTKAFVEENLARETDWVKYPSYTDRQAWALLPQNIRELYISEGNKYLEHEWKSVPATIYLEYLRSGNRRIQERYLGEITGPLKSLFMAELMEGKGRFTDQVINGIWALCESTFWGSTAHLSLQRTGRGLPNVEEPVIDLGAAATGHFLSWVYYFLHKEFDKVNYFISKRMEYEINRRILDPFYTRNDFWWLGFADRSVNNWNPYCNGHVLATVMLMEKDFRKRVDGVYKVMSSLDKFTNGYGDDGGCDEGPSYWGMAGASNFEALYLLKMVTGEKVDLFDNQLIKNMARYIYLVDISYPWFINFADAGAKTNPNPWLVYKYGGCIKDPLMTGFGSFLAEKQGYGERTFSGTTFIVFESIFDREGIARITPSEPLIRDFWLPDLQVMGARDKNGTSEGFFFAAKGGHNNESHNHNDVGSFVLYLDGNPVIVDAGVGEYTAKTFSAQRYEIWTMQSAYHNLPTINGAMQESGRTYAAKDVTYKNTRGSVIYSLNIAGAYPETAEVARWVRSYALNRGTSLEIKDDYELKSFKEPVRLSFLSAAEPLVEKGGVVQLKSPSGKFLAMKFPPQVLEASIETIELTDPRLKSNWGEKLYRILFTSKTAGLKGKTKIIIESR